MQPRPVQPRRGPTQGMSSVRRKTKIFLQLVGSFFEAVAVPTRLAELIGGARQLPTSYPGEIVLLELQIGSAVPRGGFSVRRFERADRG